MSFGFGGLQAASSNPSQSDNARADADLVEIETEKLGFQSLSGNHLLRLLPTPWPADRQPPPTASLLAVASTKGLVAAAGPDILILATAESVRQTIRDGPLSAQGGGSKIKDFTPQASLPIPRVSQVAFSSDESCLVIAAEQGGGLAVYDVNALTAGQKEPAFQIGTEGVSVRQLLPNPNPSSELAQFFGVVLEGGQLLLADLKKRELVKGANGSPIFHENVTCGCWSKLGKQIVAGRRDGTAVQIDPSGNVKAEIPVPPQLAQLADKRALSLPVSAIYWLENLDFLLIHTPVNPPTNESDDMFDAPRDDSFVHMAHRTKGSAAVGFNTVVDPAPAFSQSGRKPAHHFLQRLKEWPPALDDTLIVLSTLSSEAGLLTKSSAPLNAETPITGSFTTTSSLDTRRVGLPVSIVDNMSDTSAIGMALDLSVKELTSRPIPSEEELETSAVPLPALFVLNHEGMLSCFYFVYNASVLQKIPYPDLIAAGGPRPLDAKPVGSTPAPPATQSGFGNSGSMAPPQAPAAASGFGAASSGFGGASALGGKASPWGTAGGASPAPAFGRPSFGSPSAPSAPSAGAFGSTTPAPAAAGSAFGKPAFGTPAAPSAASGAFGSTTAAPAASGSAFGKSSFGTPSVPTPAAGAFGSTTPAPAATGSTFGKPAFGTPSAPTPAAGAFGSTTSAPAASGSTFGKSSFGTPSVPTPAAGAFGRLRLHPAAGAFGSATPSAPAATAGSTFGKPAFGAPSAPGTGSGFGAVGGMGANKASVWGTPQASPAAPAASGSTFGQASTFGGAAGAAGAAAASPFAAFGAAKASPFAAAGQAAVAKASTGANPFAAASKPTETSFGSTATFGTGNTGSFGGSTQPSLFNTTPDLGSGGSFKLGSTFKRDESAKDDGPTPSSGSSMFGGGFGSALPTTPVKAEPGTEAPIKMSEIPEVSTTPPSPPKPKVEAKQEDPLQYKAKRFAGDLPPMDVPGEDEPVQSIEGDGEKEPAEKTFAGSPPIDLGREKFGSENGGEVPVLPDEDWSEEEDEEGEEGEEGEHVDDGEDDGEDDEEDDSDAENDDENDDTRNEPTDPAGLSAFEARLEPASGQRSPEETQPDSRTPATQKHSSFTPAGFPKPPLAFPQPSNPHTSPRSPSPVRSVTAPMSRPTFGQAPASSRPTTATGPAKPQRVAVPVPAAPIPPPARAPRQPAEPTQGELEDEEDARVQQILSSAPTPTTRLPLFLAHQDYVHDGDRQGLGGQIERVYRDANGMIDTLGLNAHGLKGFVSGHNQGVSVLAKAKSLDDLEDEQSWRLGEIDALVRLQQELDEKLTADGLGDVRQVVAGLEQEARDVAKLKARAMQLKQQFAIHADPEQRERALAAPLAMEAQARQSELRQGVQELQTLLNQAEQAVSVLRAELASTKSANGSEAKKSAAPVPTIEAVERTILKMTAMIERKSGDVDVLEARIRRLPGGLAALKLGENYEDDLVASLAGNKLLGKSSSSSSPGKSTPRSMGSRSRMLANGDQPGLNAMLGGRFRTPPARRSAAFSPEASALGRSSGSLFGSASVGGSARKRIKDVSAEEVGEYERKVERRRRVLGALKQRVEGRARVVSVE